MKTENNTIKYFAYVRKSTEGEERQALSIESQKDSVRKTFPDLEIVDILKKNILLLSLTTGLFLMT